MPPLVARTALSLLISMSASAVTMDWTPIGNPGNACDPLFAGPVYSGCFGAVSYAYNIGTYEVTNAQYVEFLNAKAASDSLGLYHTQMASYGITRSGVSGSFTYSVVPGRGENPVNLVTFYDAARFANWMNNGQGNGDTETGSYTLLGGAATPSNGTTAARNGSAQIVLPTEDEWYKAAFFDSSSSSYFDYPTGSNTEVRCNYPTAAPNSANCGSLPNPPLPSSLGPTPVGSYPGSPSPYGTFDQGGNVTEWNEDSGRPGIRPSTCDPESGAACRRLRGGAWYNDAYVLAASSQDAWPAGSDHQVLGFRLAYIPEPSTGLLVVAGLLGLAVRHRVRA